MGQRCHVAAGSAVALGFVHIQHGLYPHPIAACDDAGMLAHRHDPFLHGADLVCLAGALERAVVHHDAVLTVEFCALGKVADVAADAVEAVEHTTRLHTGKG